MGTLMLVRYPLLSSPHFEEGKEAGPLSKKALKCVLHLKTREMSLYHLHLLLWFSITWMFV